MEILQVTPLYYPSLGGVQLHVKTISEALSKLGHQVSVFTLTHDRRLPRYELLAGVNIQKFPALGPEAYPIPLNLFQHLKHTGLDFDIIHAHNYGGLPLLLTALACPERTVITPHYHGHGNSRFANLLHNIYDPFATKSFNRLGRIVCVSRGEAHELSIKFGIPINSIKIIPNIISNIHTVTVGEKLKIFSDQPNQCLLLVVGRLERYKNINRIIKIMPHLPKNYFLTIIGEGREKSRLEELSSSLNVQDHVLFLGSVSNDDLINWYSRAKIVISLSEGEAFGRIVIEALASLCQVVCSDIFAFRDFAEEYPDSVTIILSDTTSESIANTIQRVASRPIFNSVLLQNYSTQVVINRLLMVYSDLIK